MGFRDRHDGGERLAAVLAARRPPLPRPAVVLALPRGGLPVAVPVAQVLDSPLDVLVARKVGAPGHEEFGVGAVAEGLAGTPPVEVRSSDARLFGAASIDAGFAREAREVVRRVDEYRHGRPLPPVRGQPVVVVDDGLATGVTAEAALRSLARAGAAPLVLAVPVAATEGAWRLGRLADLIVTVVSDDHLGAVGSWYQDFTQLTDADVVELLRHWVPAG